ncbi:DUF2849 domain-containing protein [Elstera cyanobacteriorum]|uniref:DUF2849 domain-containing protein n=1 Tax=Elstera cyanobacteriorum TaxID=2022747 RepID=UPI0023524263|nr:DUF2849 domain-containing protein [Elstera cyanobacteriorum]MCK6441420.1 DUF2849 domain-containing protein [Elstera cyanobacteriorum]
MSAKPIKAGSDAPRLLTANRLRDGAVIFYTGLPLGAGEDGFGPAWTLHLADAKLLTAAEGDAAFAAVVPAIEIVAPYLIEAEATDAGPRPVQQRERIRGSGPTVALPANPATLVSIKAA